MLGLQALQEDTSSKLHDIGEIKMVTSLQLAACSKTDRGMVRSQNEDVCLANVEQRCFMVADGMGGSAGGEVASALFHKVVSEIFSSENPRSFEESLARVKRCFSLANTKILEQATDNPVLAGMGCTAELLTLHENMFVLGHVGDSRTYRFYDDTLQQITKDHSLVQQQLDRGVISRGQAEKSRFKNILLQAVGTKSQLTVDITSGQILPATLFLLCTDGLHSMVGEKEIGPVLNYDAPLDLRAQMLVNMANDAGGKDNISVTLVELL